jgi:hypothetical protein
MTLGPDGALYVSNVGFGDPNAGDGQIVRIDLSQGAVASAPVRVPHGATPAVAHVPSWVLTPGLDGAVMQRATWTSGNSRGAPGSHAASLDGTALARHGPAALRAITAMSQAQDVDQLFADLDSDFLAPAAGLGLAW